MIEVKHDKILLTRSHDQITLGGKFPRLTKQDAKTRLKEIKKLLLALLKGSVLDNGYYELAHGHRSAATPAQLR